ncbi:hypothetical protein Pedsa_0396 [Pseudopedobacter saltans DSM 12145]|uniref:DUF2809 domain-containing protein n=1 Tax=Pseudopedobacter saltans (strain ATCC 51119 / DSM 12145 / JCM 21818 / CCUG 39354 / LMG 10337 / NBRC 100064 / NCIMB 13643) TaxID=762903 RepID=F0S561_PSESL|nr:DUF2809 domain-containing protein [Pseudopedobacter saltans]ADY50978.1 hypothetical protein Pedsa_0396 [Pseudopedobacter saltans DSM 12145]
MFKFSRINLAIAILLFLIEVFIALFINDNIIRPYIGDVLVVILLYYMAKSFFDFPPVKTAIAVLLFAYCIETLQYFNIVRLLGLSHSKIANIIIGTHFSWIDILAYTVGTAIILTVENFKRTKNTRMTMN